MLKKLFFQLHWFFGITAGLILSVMGITGAIYSYDQQILEWLNQDSYVVKAEAQAKLNPAEIYQHFQKTQPEYKINSITVLTEPTASSIINIEKEGERRGLNLMINPYDATLLPEIKGRDAIRFVMNLHRNLTVGPVGKQITGACTLILIYFILSGIYLRWPKRHSFKQWFALKPKLKGRNFIWDLHAVVGTWLVLFYLLFAITGLYWSYDWWRNGLFKVLGVEHQQQSSHTPPKSHNAPATHGGKAEHTRSKNPSASRHQNDARVDDSLSPVEIQNALTQTWKGFNLQFNHKYSFATFNVPKENKDEVEIVFYDPIPQHERPRNRATYNFQTSSFTRLDLYEDKKLTEKIMSSMLPVHRGSFFGPIYQFVAMLASLTMPLFFITGLMLYLKRRKQKKLTHAAKLQSLDIVVDPNSTPWLIAYASQTGVAEQLAWRTVSSLQSAHQAVTVKSVQHLNLKEIEKFEKILVIASTYGTGDAPDLAAYFDKKILGSSAVLSHCTYAVLALGSKEYSDSYCSFGHKIDAWFKQHQAKSMFELIEVNDQDPVSIEAWNSALSQVLNFKLDSMNIQKIFDPWILVKRELLNAESQGAPAFNLELNSQHDMDWKAGDIAEIQPGNSKERIQRFLNKHHLAEKTFVPSLNCTIEQAIWDKNLDREISLDSSIDQFISKLETLPSREYSIASIPPQGVLRLVVRQQSNSLNELGLGSGWLTQHLAVGDSVSLRIRTNESFHLINDNRPAIFIGNGTGIAGLMSLISARIRLDYTKNWLIFGERQQAHDYFYQSTIQAWKNTAMLERLDLAFSRDQAEKVYVHHKLRDHADLLIDWIRQGAVIYVCGSIDGMATDVENALNDILGESTVDELRQTGRYRRDVY